MIVSLLNTFRSIALGNTGAVVKNKAGVLGGVVASNANAAVRFLKLYDKASAASSADTPILTLLIPAGGSVHFSFAGGVTLVNGLSARCVTGIADNDTTPAGANEVSVSIFHQ